VAKVANFHPTPQVVTKPAFAEYPLRYSIDLVEFGARSMDLVDLEFSELGCLAEKIGVELFFESGDAWSPPEHTLIPQRTHVCSG
jgi:hypothetical protein